MKTPQIPKDGVGHQIHVMFIHLFERSVSEATKFVDRLNSTKKLALRNYWLNNNCSEYFDLYFNK